MISKKAKHSNTSVPDTFVKPKPGLARWLSAIRNTRDGFIYGLSKEAAIREEFLLLLLGVPLAVWIAPSIHWLLAMVLSLLVLILVETLNTAIEITLDRISIEINPKTKAAKDLGSLAVFITLTIVVLVWLCAIFS